jgi:hypothetical protein
MYASLFLRFYPNRNSDSLSRFKAFKANSYNGDFVPAHYACPVSKVLFFSESDAADA